MELPVISFIIPAYNAEKTILNCVNTILNCDYPQDKKEIIVVNNNSTDRTAEILNRLSVKTIIEKSQGRSYARNSGAKQARGEILAFIDADCEIDRNWARAVALEFKLPRVGAVQGPIIPAPDQSENLLSKFRFYKSEKSTEGTHTLLDLVTLKFPMIDSATCAYRKTAFDQVSGFDILLERHEDIDLSKRVFCSGFIVASCPGAISKVYWHGEGWKDFLQRAIAHGKTQVDYEKKWDKQETPIKSIYYMLGYKILYLFRKNIFKCNFLYEIIDAILTSLSYFSFSYYWFSRNYNGEKNKIQNSSASNEHFFCYNQNDEIKKFYFSPDINFAFLTNKALVKNINRDTIIQFNEIYYFFLKEILTGTKSSDELILECHDKYEIENKKIQDYLKSFITSLQSHQLIELID